MTNEPKIDTFIVTDRAQWLKWRKSDVTASVAAALFGDSADIHPYMTPYELFCLKAGLIEEDVEDTPTFRRGRLLEPVAIELLKEDRPTWKIAPCGYYFRDVDHHIGATPDAFAIRPDIEGRGVIQIKSVGKFAFEKGWLDHNKQVDLPLWIAVQASVEAALTNSTWAAVGAMALGDGGLDMHVIDIPIKPKLMIEIRKLALDFWRRVKDNDPYPPEYGRDAAVIAARYRPDEGNVVDLSDNPRMVEWLTEREGLKAREADGTAANKDRKKLEAELMHLLGNASAAIVGGKIVEVKTVKRGAYSVAPSQYSQVGVKDVGGSASKFKRGPRQLSMDSGEDNHGGPF